MTIQQCFSYQYSSMLSSGTLTSACILFFIRSVHVFVYFVTFECLINDVCTRDVKITRNRDILFVEQCSRCLISLLRFSSSRPPSLSLVLSLSVFALTHLFVRPSIQTICYSLCFNICVLYNHYLSTVNRAHWTFFVRLHIFILTIWSFFPFRFVFYVFTIFILYKQFKYDDYFSMCHRIIGERMKSKQMVLRIVCRLPFHHHHHRFNAFIVVMVICFFLFLLFASAWPSTLTSKYAEKWQKRAKDHLFFPQIFSHFRFISYFHLLFLHCQLKCVCVC